MLLTQSVEPHVDFDYSAVEVSLAEIKESNPSDYKECARRFVRVLHAALDWMADTPEKWAIMFATAHPDCAGRSQADIAAQLGVTRAHLSALAWRFCDERGLPPSTYMRSAEASRMARKIRIAYLRKHPVSK